MTTALPTRSRYRPTHGVRAESEDRRRNTGRREPHTRLHPDSSPGSYAAAGENQGEQAALRDAKVLLVDDSTLHREALAAAFANNGLPIPGMASDLPTMVLALSRFAPDMVLIDIDTRDFAVLLRTVPGICPSAKVVVLGISEDDDVAIVACAEAGVVGYHLRNGSSDDLLVLMRKIASGEVLCPPRISGTLIRRLSELAAELRDMRSELGLTARETQVLTMLDRAMSNREIAESLGIAIHTVKNHVHSVLAKLGVSSRAEAVRKYRAAQIAPTGPRD